MQVKLWKVLSAMQNNQIKNMSLICSYLEAFNRFAAAREVSCHPQLPLDCIVGSSCCSLSDNDASESSSKLKFVHSPGARTCSAQREKNATHMCAPNKIANAIKRNTWIK